MLKELIGLRNHVSASLNRIFPSHLPANNISVSGQQQHCVVTIRFYMERGYIYEILIAVSYIFSFVYTQLPTLSFRESIEKGPREPPKVDHLKEVKLSK